MVAAIRKVREEFGFLGNMSAHPVKINSNLLVEGQKGEIEFYTAEALFQALRFKDGNTGIIAMLVE